MVNRWVREAFTGIARAGGFYPTGRRWVDQIKHLEGEFGPSLTESAVRWIVSACCAFACAARAFAGVRNFRADFPTDVARLDEAGAFVFLVLLAVLLYWSWRRYIFENGTVRCVWANGHELWREDLEGLQDIICTTGQGGTSMKLKWAQHSRYIQLYDGLRRALEGESIHEQRRQR